MRSALIVAAVLNLIALASGYAALIPYYRLENLVEMSDAIILCEERGYTNPDPSRHEGYRVQCFIARVYKGRQKAGTIIQIGYDSLFERRDVRFMPWSSTEGKKEHDRIPTWVPLGKALIFLKLEDDNHAGTRQLYPFAAKLIQGNAVLEFGQFLGNPGRLFLAPQKPENITLRPGEVYGEKRLLEDLEYALAHPKPFDIWSSRTPRGNN